MVITCPRCERTSHHPEDEKAGYCGFCHWWTSDPAGILNQDWVLDSVFEQGEQ